MEIKRLLGKKVLLAGILIYLFQAVTFTGLQITDVGLEETLEQNRQYNQLVEVFQNRPVQDSLHAVEYLLSEDRNAVTVMLANKLTYLNGFEESIQTIFDNAQRLTGFSIFQDTSSYSYANTVKTAGDFERMRGVSLSLDKDRATEHVLEYSYLGFFVFAFMVYVLYELLRERDNGMWEVTHILKNGRCRLAVMRGCGLAVITVAFYLLCFVTNIVISCAFYGLDHFGGLIQTIQAYARYPVPITKGAYLLLNIGKSSIALIMVVLFAYLIFTVLRSRNLAVVVLLAGFAGEWRLLGIPVYSNLKMLRYINLMRIFDSTALDQEYQNLNLFGAAVRSSWVLFWVEAVLLLLCFILAVLIYGRQYPGKSVWFENLFKPVKTVFQRILEALPFSLKEAYKILVSKQGILFLVFGLIASVWIFQKTEVHFPNMQQDMDEAYLSYGGSDWNSFNAYVEALTEKREQSLLEAERIQEQMRAGILGPEALPEISMLQSQAAGILIYLQEYNAKQALYQTVLDQQGIQIYAMSDRGYNEIIGSNSKLRELVIGVAAITIAVIFAAQSFGAEKQAHTKPLLKSTMRGIIWLWRKKLICILGMVGLLNCIFYGGDLIALLQRYRTPYLEAPIQSLTFYAADMAHISILLLLILHMLFRFIFTVCAAALTLLISSHRNVVNQMYVPLLIVAFSIFYIIVMSVGAVWLLFMAAAVSLLLTVLGIVGSYRNWCLS